MHTVLDVVQAYLPRGTSVDHSAKLSWREPPAHPATVFAVGAALLQRSGGYQHLLSAPGLDNGAPAHQVAGLTVLVTKRDHDAIAQAARQWRNLQKPSRPPQAILDWWKLVLKSGHLPIVEGTLTPEQPPKWWHPAAMLMLAADSASSGLGFLNPTQKGIVPWFESITNHLLSPASNDGRGIPPSIAEVPTALNCVLPKTRTPNVGCTLRSLSLNLALLPPEGIVSARWIDPIAVKSDANPLTILAVPFPFAIPARAFNPEPRRSLTWDSFDLRQTWLSESRSGPRDFSNLIADHLRFAESNVETINAIVLPELALNWDYFEYLTDYLLEKTRVEFLISGLSTDPSGQRGNFVATAMFLKEPDGTLISVRAKHHRWKLDERQIRQYALGAVLDPTKTWWENFGISQREVEIFRFRKNSTFTTLICEDLARSDPCQELLRSIGPNLVFALLMDGPQLKPRWSARYATALADDPGCSVLTLTSLGLIARQCENGFDGPLSIALWKDDRSDVREITLRPGETGAVLSLTPRVGTNAYTMDGRGKKVVSWHLGGVSAVRLKG